MNAGTPPAPNAPSDTDAPTAADSPGAQGTILSTTAAGPAAVRGGAMRVGGYVVGTLVSILSAALLFRHLGKDDTGLYITALSLVAIVAALSDLGLTAVGVRELATRPPDERWTLARDLLGLRITLTLVGAVLVTAVAAAAYSSTIALGVALGCLGLMLQATQDNFALPLTVELRLGWVSVLDLTRQLLTTALTVLLVVAGASLVPFLAIPIPVGLVVVAMTVVLVRGVHSLAPTFSWSRWKRFMHAMLPYSVAVAASALYFRVAILLVSALSTPAQLGYFSASFRIIEVLTTIPALLAGAAFPIFAHAAGDDHDRLGYALGRVFEVALIAGAWAAVGIAVGAPLGIAIIGGPEFEPAVPVLAVQGVALGAMFVSLVWANAMLSLGQFRTDPADQRRGPRAQLGAVRRADSDRRGARRRDSDGGHRDRRGGGAGRRRGARQASAPPAAADRPVRRARRGPRADAARDDRAAGDRAPGDLHGAVRRHDPADALPAA